MAEQYEYDKVRFKINFKAKNGKRYKFNKKYKLVLSKTLQKNKKAKKFEMEDIFIKGSRIYFGAYGGKGNYNDIFGSTKK